jgi:sulfoxide reductase heme-binding subunit YedZ
LSRVGVLKVLSTCALSGPLLWLSWLVYLDVREPGAGLGADAGEAVVHFLGEWSLIALLLAYTITPLRRLFNFPDLIRIRRLVGLCAFGYVSLHVFSYVALYLGFEWRALLEDFVERTYITAGLGAFLCLAAMAATSTRGWQRRLGLSWKRLHQLVHVALALALTHLWWLTKDGYAEVFLYSVWFGALGVERLVAGRRFKPWRRGAQSLHH